MKFSLVNVHTQINGNVSGNWLQDVHGTLGEATKRARDTETVNGNKITVAVVPFLCGSQRIIQEPRLDIV